MDAEYDSRASHDRLGKVRLHDWETSHEFLIEPEEARALARKLIRCAALAELDARTVAELDVVDALSETKRGASGYGSTGTSALAYEIADQPARLSFIERCLRGEVADPATQIHDEIAEWHDSPRVLPPLHEWLGLTWLEYAEWVQRDRALMEILRRRRAVLEALDRAPVDTEPLPPELEAELEQRIADVRAGVPMVPHADVERPKNEGDLR